MMYSEALIKNTSVFVNEHLLNALNVNDVDQFKHDLFHNQIIYMF